MAVAVNVAMPVAVVQMAVADPAAVAPMSVVVVVMPMAVAPVHLRDQPAFAGASLRAERRQGRGSRRRESCCRE